MFIKPILGDHTQGKKHLYITRHIPHIQEPLNTCFFLLKQELAKAGQIIFK